MSTVPQQAGASIIICVASAMLAMPALAQQSVPTAWRCAACEQSFGWLLDTELGIAANANDNFRFGNATGLDDSGARLFGDIYARYRDDKANYLVIDGYLRGENQIGLFVKGTRQSRLQLRAAYQAIPVRRHGSTVSPYSTGSNQTLGPDWLRASTTTGMTALASSLQVRPIESDYHVLKLGAGYQFANPWDVQLDVRRREQQGTSIFGGSFYFNAAELAAPVDQAVNNLDASIGYSTDTWQARLKYFASTFENSIDRIEWENAYSVPFGVALGQAAAAPDNEAHQLAVSGSIVLPMRTTLSGSVASGRMMQNSTLLPYTVNASLPDTPLPVNSANAVVDTSNVMLRATSSPWRPVTLELQFHSNDHNNKTASNRFDVVVTDATVGTPTTNPIYDYKRDTWKLRGEYRPWRALAINLGFSTRDATREQQDRLKTTTDKIWLELRSRVRGVISLKGDFYSEDRNGSSFVSPDNVVPSQNPLMRKYNLADRRRNGIRLRASLLNFESFDISAEFEAVDDDYRNSTIGLTGSESHRFVIDMTWARRDLVVYLSAANEDIRIDQQNSQSFASPDWASTNRDRFTTGSVGLTWNDLVGEMDLQFDYSYNESLGRIDTDTSGRLLEFPDLEGSRQTLRIGIRMPLRETMSIGIDYFFEQVRNDDWALDGVMPDTVPTLLSLGADAWNYSSNVFYLNFRYRRD